MRSNVGREHHLTAPLIHHKLHFFLVQFYTVTEQSQHASTGEEPAEQHNIRDAQGTKTFRNTMLLPSTDILGSLLQLQSGENGQENESNGLYGSVTLAVHFTTNSIRFEMATGRTFGRKYN